ncbi:MAG: biopolymer transporter ExbD [Bacteroidales bacterium]|nr:biopolymer transporter ExbD [Bacteroidales bacterium]
MAKFARKGKGGTPAISTASLPDIVFMLLFFFMTVTTMKETDLKVTIHKAHATEVKKIENKALVKYINIGVPIKTYQSKFGKEPIIQLNDAFASVGDIGPWVDAVRGDMDAENRSKMTTALKIDKNARMGIVTDVKQELRRAKALKITYIADKTTKENFK